jgi:hypothetical protein
MKTQQFRQIGVDGDYEICCASFVSGGKRFPREGAQQMESSWTEVRSKFKLPLRVVGWCLWRRLQQRAGKCQRFKRQRDEARREVARQEVELARRQEQLGELQNRLRKLEAAHQRLVAAPCRLPDDPPLEAHKYGLRMICLAINLARVVGLRPAERALTVFWGWLGVEQPLPDWTTIRTWLMRLGVAILEEPLEEADDRVWMVDHSNQIGPEKVLVVLGVRASQLPPPGEPLGHADVRVLLVQPGTRWKREDMAAVYDRLGERCGPPRAVLCDGAVELREGAERLKKGRFDTIVVQDFKHKAAIYLKSLLENGPRFAEFNTALGKTRSAIQQTEMSHLTPPSPKPKARFMNLGPTLEWASAIAWLFEHPNAESRRGIAPERLEEKLGWLRPFAPDLAAWRECQQVVNAGLKFINEQGLSCGAAERLRAALATTAKKAASQQLADRLVDFVAGAEAELQPGERLPMSTEILESTFALYKQLEGQHSKGGFTSLLACFAALLAPATEERIRRSFSKVSVKRVREWTKTNLGTTLGSKRRALYTEFRNATEIVTAT